MYRTKQVLNQYVTIFIPRFVILICYRIALFFIASVWIGLVIFAYKLFETQEYDPHLTVDVRNFSLYLLTKGKKSIRFELYYFNKHAVMILLGGRSCFWMDSLLCQKRKQNNFIHQCQQVSEISSLQIYPRYKYWR